MRQTSGKEWPETAAWTIIHPEGAAIGFAAATVDAVLGGGGRSWRRSTSFPIVPSAPPGAFPLADLVLWNRYKGEGFS